jgi:hypothetical protein
MRGNQGIIGQFYYLIQNITAHWYLQTFFCLEACLSKYLSLQVSIIRSELVSFHFRFNTNSGGFFPMQSSFYLKPQGHQIWA